MGESALEEEGEEVSAWNIFMIVVLALNVVMALVNPSRSGALGWLLALLYYLFGHPAVWK